MTDKIQAKRKLFDFDFSKEGAHVALVDKAANGHEVLVIKSEVDVNKAEIQVKMDVVRFLSTFFGMWYGEAATLAEIFGVDTGYFDESYSFNEFNSIGASEVSLMKSAGEVEKTEEALSEFVNNLPSEDLNTLKAFAESFNTKLKVHKEMTEIEKALEAQKVELEKAAQVEIEKAQKEAADAKAELAEINKAKEEARKTEYLDLAKSFGAEGDDLGLAMAVVAMTEQGVTVIKALEDAHKRLEVAIEKEAGFTGDQDDAPEETSIMKAMKAKYETK